MATDTIQIPHPPIASAEEWLEARRNLLAEEKELTHHKDRVNAKRRNLPMVKVTKSYIFDGPKGKVGLLDLFDGKTQLIVHHFMFGPDWEKGCPGCTGHVNALGNISSLEKVDTKYVIISRAPLEKLEAYRAVKGWNHPWYSSGESEFNFDYNVSFREGDPDSEYNYAPGGGHHGEAHGMSVFFRMGDEVYHTYSSYARGVESITDTYSFLDLTPYGRQEDFEDSPEGWPQFPTYG